MEQTSSRPLLGFETAFSPLFKSTTTSVETINQNDISFSRSSYSSPPNNSLDMLSHNPNTVLQHCTSKGSVSTINVSATVPYYDKTECGPCPVMTTMISPTLVNSATAPSSLHSEIMESVLVNQPAKDTNMQIEQQVTGQVGMSLTESDGIQIDSGNDQTLILLRNQPVSREEARSEYVITFPHSGGGNDVATTSSHVLDFDPNTSFSSEIGINTEPQTECVLHVLEDNVILQNPTISHVLNNKPITDILEEFEKGSDTETNSTKTKLMEKLKVKNRFANVISTDKKTYTKTHYSRETSYHGLNLPKICTCTNTQEREEVPAEQVFIVDGQMYRLQEAMVMKIGHLQMHAFLKNGSIFIPKLLLFSLLCVDSKNLLKKAMHGNENFKLENMMQNDLELIRQKYNLKITFPVQKMIDLVSVRDLAKSIIKEQEDPMLDILANKPYMIKVLGSDVRCSLCGSKIPKAKQGDEFVTIDLDSFRNEGVETSRQAENTDLQDGSTDLVDVTVGQLVVHRTNFQAFNLKDKTYISVKDMVTENIFSLEVLQSKLSTLKYKPIIAPPEVVEVLTELKSSTANSLWVDTDAVMAICKTSYNGVSKRHDLLLHFTLKSFVFEAQMQLKTTDTSVSIDRYFVNASTLDIDGKVDYCSSSDPFQILQLDQPTSKYIVLQEMLKQRPLNSKKNSDIKSVMQGNNDSAPKQDENLMAEGDTRKTEIKQNDDFVPCNLSKTNKVACLSVSQKRGINQETISKVLSVMDADDLRENGAGNCQTDSDKENILKHSEAKENAENHESDNMKKSVSNQGHSQGYSQEISRKNCAEIKDDKLILLVGEQYIINDMEQFKSGALAGNVEFCNTENLKVIVSEIKNLDQLINGKILESNMDISGPHSEQAGIVDEIPDLASDEGIKVEHFEKEKSQSAKKETTKSDISSLKQVSSSNELVKHASNAGSKMVKLGTPIKERCENAYLDLQNQSSLQGDLCSSNPSQQTTDKYATADSVCVDKENLAGQSPSPVRYTNLSPLKTSPRTSKIPSTPNTPFTKNSPVKHDCNSSPGKSLSSRVDKIFSKIAPMMVPSSTNDSVTPLNMLATIAATEEIGSENEGDNSETSELVYSAEERWDFENKIKQFVVFATSRTGVCVKGFKEGAEQAFPALFYPSIDADEARDRRKQFKKLVRRWIKVRFPRLERKPGNELHPSQSKVKDNGRDESHCTATENTKCQGHIDIAESTEGHCHSNISENIQGHLKKYNHDHTKGSQMQTNSSVGSHVKGMAERQDDKFCEFVGQQSVSLQEKLESVQCGKNRKSVTEFSTDHSCDNSEIVCGTNEKQSRLEGTNKESFIGESDIRDIQNKRVICDKNDCDMITTDEDIDTLHREAKRTHIDGSTTYSDANTTIDSSIMECSTGESNTTHHGSVSDSDTFPDKNIKTGVHSGISSAGSDNHLSTNIQVRNSCDVITKCRDLSSKLIISSSNGRNVPSDKGDNKADSSLTKKVDIDINPVCTNRKGSRNNANDAKKEVRLKLCELKPKTSSKSGQNKLTKKQELCNKQYSDNQCAAKRKGKSDILKTREMRIKQPACEKESEQSKDLMTEPIIKSKITQKQKKRKMDFSKLKQLQSAKCSVKQTSVGLRRTAKQLKKCPRSNHQRPASMVRGHEQLNDNSRLDNQVQMLGGGKPLDEDLFVVDKKAKKIKTAKIEDIDKIKSDNKVRQGKDNIPKDNGKSQLVNQKENLKDAQHKEKDKNVPDSRIMSLKCAKLSKRGKGTNMHNDQVKSNVKGAKNDRDGSEPDYKVRKTTSAKTAEKVKSNNEIRPKKEDMQMKKDSFESDNQIGPHRNDSKVLEERPSFKNGNPVGKRSLTSMRDSKHMERAPHVVEDPVYVIYNDGEVTCKMAVEEPKDMSVKRRPESVLKRKALGDPCFVKLKRMKFLDDLFNPNTDLASESLPDENF